MAKKKKTLPANFNELIEAKDLDALKAVFNECELNAYDRRSFKTPALSFYKIPLELMDCLLPKEQMSMREMNTNAPHYTITPK